MDTDKNSSFLDREALKTHHVLNRRGDSLGLDGIDLPKCKTEEAITRTFGELNRQLGSELDGLVLDTKTAQRDIVSADDT